MKVYVVYSIYTDTFSNDHFQAEAVFSTKEKALGFITLQEKDGHLYSWNYTELELDRIPARLDWNA